LPHEGLDDPFVYNPVATPTETTTYTLTVTNEEGCKAVRQITIYVISPDCREPNIFVPNAFTPNGDGNNDVLYVRSNIIESMEFAIYNRWGQKVFETTEQSIGWDGTYKGQELPNDVFGYYLKAKCFNGEEFFKKGNISLMR
jgi:gliding motility-associated-like protein